MAPPRISQRTGQPGWTMMTAIHDALRRDPDQLIHTTASPAAGQVRWGVFRGHLQYHLVTEDTLMWRPGPGPAGRRPPVGRPCWTRCKTSTI